MPVFRKQKGYELRMHAFVASEISTEEAADQISVNGCFVSWEMDVFKFSEQAFQICSELLYLGGFSCSVQAFKDYQHKNDFLYHTKLIKNLSFRAESGNLFLFLHPVMNRKIEIMGIVNLTDDSYFAESRCADVGEAVSRVGRMLEEGADIIDFGACSTRPGSLPVGKEEEWKRLEPVLREVSRVFPGIRVSVDTYWSDVVRRAFDVLGDFVVNDISAGEDDPMMLETVGELGLEYVAMHKRGNPETMQQMTDYDDVTLSVVRYFEDFAVKAEAAGISKWILDPGFGFAKNVAQNYKILSDLNKLRRSYGGYVPDILVGVSRKSMIYRTLGISPDEALAPTQAVHMAALLNGADILRVHDVASALQTVRLFCCLDWPNL